MNNYKFNHFIVNYQRCNQRPFASSFILSTARPFSLYSKLFVMNDSKVRSRWENFLRKMGKLDYSKRKLHFTGMILYTKCTDGVDYSEFQKFCNLDDTFFSWFLLTELHVWMSMVRLMSEGDEGRLVRNSLIECLWKDTQTRAKKLGAGGFSERKKRITELHQQFLASLFHYDEGLLSNDKILAAALWRLLLQRNCSNPHVLEGLVCYVRKQILHLESYNREQILLQGDKVLWLPLTDPTLEDQL